MVEGKGLTESVILYADGASRGNPGPAGAGVVFYDESGRSLAEASAYLGKTTNNVAEYRALILGLEPHWKAVSGRYGFIAIPSCSPASFRGDTRSKART